MKVINLYPKPALQPTRELAVGNSAISFEGDSATANIGDETDYITFSSVVKNETADGITIVYTQNGAETTSATTAGTTVTVALGYQEDQAASLTTAMAGANNDVVFTAVTAGTSGNSITVALVDPAANDQALSISVAGTDISVSLATGPAGAITTTATELLTALNADDDANDLITTALKAGNSGAGIVTALASTPLAGGEAAGIIATLADIKAAVEANAPTSELITCEITGTDTTVATLGSPALLTGGAEAFDLDVHYVWVNVKSQSVYVTFDGSTPSSTNGLTLPSGYIDIWSSHTARTASFIQGSGAARVCGVPLCD